jgi:formamidopyrimidine-DNA glycosylase
LSGRPARQLLFWNQRGLGVVRLMSPRTFARQCGPDRLGPDALSITTADLRQRLASSRRAIKVALLDQRALAGVGNLYASEILHRAGLHPETPCTLLTPRQWRRLREAMGEVLDEAIRHQGSTLRDGTYRIARNEPGNYQVCHRVYQRHGEPCLRCGKAEIRRIVQAQRSTFFCPRCQRPPRTRPD